MEKKVARKIQNVTVLIPSYNHGHVLGYQIESLLNQTSPPKHIIVLDDGSTDRTQQMLQRYEQNENVKIIIKKQNVGVHAAMGLLLNEVHTEFFAFAAADDLLTSNWCMATASLLGTYKDAKMAISNSFIFKNNKVSLTDSITPLNGKSDGIYTPAQYMRLLMRHGRFPPSNTILYRSDIIEELIRPVLLKKELTSLVDIFLILAIATRYPIAYSTRPTGVFVRDQQSYGNAFLNKRHLEDVVANIRLFSIKDEPVLCDELIGFLTRYVAYSWSKQMVMADLRNNRDKTASFQTFYDAVIGYLKLLTLFVMHKRYLYVKRPTLIKSKNSSYTLDDFIDRGLLKRFESAA